MEKISLLKLFLFLRKRGSQVSEVELLKEFLGGYREIVRNGLTTELFHMHFMLYHNLYRLADRLEKTPFYLHIENMFVSLYRKPGRGRCLHFNLTDRRFCGSRTETGRHRFCSMHETEDTGPEASRAAALRKYYLDLSNDNEDEARRIIQISRGMMKRDKKAEQEPEEKPATIGVEHSALQYSVDRLERRHWQMAKNYEDVCTGFIGDFTDFNRAYTILSRIESEDRRSGPAAE